MLIKLDSSVIIGVNWNFKAEIYVDKLHNRTVINIIDYFFFRSYILSR